MRQAKVTMAQSASCRDTQDLVRELNGVLVVESSFSKQ